MQESGPGRALIVDDQPLARADLFSLLEPYNALEVIAEASTLDEARAHLRAGDVDLVFLDIQLRGETGFELIEDLPVGTDLVFVTAHDEYAVRAFEVNALDYLVKPVSPPRLEETVSRLMKQRPSRSPPVIPLESDDRLLVASGSSQSFVSLDEIRAVIVWGGNYSILELEDGSERTVRRALKTWEEVLPEPFCRVHRSSIANLRFAKSLARGRGGIWHLDLEGRAEPLKVSRRRVSDVRAQIASLRGYAEG